MNLKAQRAAAIKAAQEIIAKGDLTEDDRARLKELDEEVQDLTAKIESAKADEDLIARLNSLAPPEDGGVGEDGPAKSLGEHFVKHVGMDGLARVKTLSGHTVAAPEFKAAGDTHTTPGAVAPWLTEYDKTVVRAFRRAVVSDLLGTGAIGSGSNAISYLVEGAAEGTPAAVQEAGAKPQFHFADPTPKTDALRKIAGFLKITDEMYEDAEFLVSEINQRGLYLLALAEENQLLNGTGASGQIEGLLLRSGVQTGGDLIAADNTDNAEAIYRAMTAVQDTTGLAPDALIINPVDYQRLRLMKDGNGQYFGGGFFSGQYGQGGIDWQPAVWGLSTVVSAAVPAKTAVVGALKAATTVYRKGGVRIEATNSHDKDFTNNIVTTRIEERVALAVRVPAAVAKVTLSDSDPA